MKPKYTYDPASMPMETLEPDLRQVNPVCLDILYRRGFRTSQEVRDMLYPSLETATAPLHCQDIGKALNILEKAVKEKIPVTVYRDYDVDGITAGAVAVEALRKLGVTARHYVNDRAVDGFGICTHGIDTILQRWPDTGIILTVDNGIVGHEAIDYANSHGLTVVVTDHHEQGATLPNAAAVVDLKRVDESSPYRQLCGCGLIFRIMLDLYRRLGADTAPVLHMLDLVALATVADVVPLIGENRALVREGLKQIQNGKRPFFKAMCRLYNTTEVTAHRTLSFQFIPILNSLSRMGQDTAPAVDALISTDEVWVEQQVADFWNMNQARKEQTRVQYTLALSLLDLEPPDPILILCDERFDDGIAGILAGRLKERFARPALVMTPIGGGLLRGSARSVEGFDIKAALDECSAFLTFYGGHPKAAGVTLPDSRYEAFARKLTELSAAALSGKELRTEVPLAAVLSEEQLTETLVRDLRILEPYGEGFPEPVFGLIAQPDRVSYMGSEDQHVKFTCSRSGLSIIRWNGAEWARSLSRFPRKFVGKPSLNVWNGTVSVQFIQEN